MIESTSMKKVKVILLVLSLFLFCINADASLYNDPCAIAAYSGTTAFNLAHAGSILNAAIEYAVFAPGQYSKYDPSGGSSIDLVYTDMSFGTLSGGGLGGMDALATPIPEPATIALLAPAIFALRNKRKKL